MHVHLAGFISRCVGPNIHYGAYIDIGCHCLTVCVVVCVDRITRSLVRAALHYIYLTPAQRSESESVKVQLPAAQDFPQIRSTLSSPHTASSQIAAAPRGSEDSNFRYY